MKDIFQVVRTIQLSEKATLLTELNNEYVFKVDRGANKLEVKEAIEKIFGKKVVKVRTCNYQGKKKRERRADFGRKPHWKKAYVKLKEGESIDLV